MALIPQSDEDYLKQREFEYELKEADKEVRLIIRNWALPAAYNPRSAEVLIRILPGYPLTQLDMFWTNPDVKLTASGAFPDRADVHETYDGRTWQRWSRHPQEWRAGIDNLRTIITSISMELNRGY